MKRYKRTRRHENRVESKDESITRSSTRRPYEAGNKTWTKAKKN